MVLALDKTKSKVNIWGIFVLSHQFLGQLPESSGVFWYFKVVFLIFK
jgi:hypothetical protein